MRPDAIKLAMREHLRGRAPGALIIDELGIGAAVADMALVSDALMCGYEIKSQADTVKRLPGQVDAYSLVFDRCAVVCHPRHVAHAEQLTPSWWGLILIEDGRFFALREPAPNPAVSAQQLVSLVWRDEAYMALRAIGLGHGLRSARKHQLHLALLDALDLDGVRALVRVMLRTRPGWLADDGQRKLEGKAGGAVDPDGSRARLLRRALGRPGSR